VSVSSATSRVSSRAQRRGASIGEVGLRDLAAIDFMPPPLALVDDVLRRRWERIALGDRA
jgi:hypothetical protein